MQENIACKISLQTFLKKTNKIFSFTVFFVGVDMRNVGGVKDKTVVQVVAIQCILETLRLIKILNIYYKEEKQVL